MKTSLRAFLLDFDGVLVDTEPLHLALFQEVLAAEGLSLTETDYFEKYLGLDDRSVFGEVFKDRGKSLTPDQRAKLVEKKHAVLMRKFESGGGRSLFLPGVPEFLGRISQKYYVAIVSGALRSEIETILKGHEKGIHLIVAAEDVSRGKPDPEGFLKAIQLLNRDFVPSSEILLAEECLVVEDSPWGIEAAKKAGTKCLALTTSYPRERLTAADRIAPNLKALRWEEIETIFGLTDTYR